MHHGIGHMVGGGGPVWGEGRCFNYIYINNVHFISQRVILDNDTQKKVEMGCALTGGNQGNHGSTVQC